jgi:DNA-binding MarR family transcriptional regulator
MTATPNRDELIRTLFDSMDTTKRGIYAQMQALHRSLPIPRSQLELLTAIKHAQPVSFKDLAAQLYLSPGAISQLAEGLEQQELIQRQSDPKDRRIHCLEITKKGEKLLQSIAKRRRSIMEAVAAELTDEELKLWLRIQQKLLKKFQSQTTDNKKETA